MATIAAGYGKQRHSSIPCQSRSIPGCSNHVLLSGAGWGNKWSRARAPSTSARSPSSRSDSTVRDRENVVQDSIHMVGRVLCESVPQEPELQPSHRRHLPSLVLADQQTRPFRRPSNVLAQMSAEVVEREEESTQLQGPIAYRRPSNVLAQMRAEVEEMEEESTQMQGPIADRQPSNVLAQMNAEVAEMEEESTRLQAIIDAEVDLEQGPMRTNIDAEVDLEQDLMRTNIDAEVDLEQEAMRSSNWREADATSDSASTVSEHIGNIVETDEQITLEEPGNNAKRDAVELEAYQEIVKILSSDRDALEQRCQELENKFSQCSAELAAALSKIEKVEAEKNDLHSKLADCQEQGRCVICLSETADQIVLPCAHLALCSICRRGAGAGCPVCRQTIQSIIQVYKP